MNTLSRINQYMTEQLLQDSSELTKVIRQVAIFNILMYLIIVPVVWWRVQRSLLEEKLKWKRSFRLVPIPLIKSNKMIKSHLFRNTINHFWWFIERTLFKLKKLMRNWIKEENFYLIFDLSVLYFYPPYSIIWIEIH